MDGKEKNINFLTSFLEYFFLKKNSYQIIIFEKIMNHKEDIDETQEKMSGEG